MNDRVFIDTNVWVYYFQAMDEPGKTAARKLIDNCFSYAVISVQVLGELFSVMTKKGNDPERSAAIIEACINNFHVTEIRVSVVSAALWIIRKYGYSYYDSLIIASALEAGCTTLYTEYLQHRQLIEGKLRIVNPFVS
jgi:predicted nucleic acid-binding protein